MSATRYSDEVIDDFIAGCTAREQSNLVQACRKKKFQLWYPDREEWYECVNHGRYWREDVNGCSRPFQDKLEFLDIAVRTNGTRQP